MAADDEAKARASLVAMMERISRGPHAALGVTHTATHQQVRSAFLQLTKRFHPAKFARMSTELQKLSNEVFLGIKAAHDLLANGSALRGTPAAKGGAPQPPTKPAEGSTSMRPQTGALPLAPKPVTGPIPPKPAPPTAAAPPAAPAPATARTTTGAQSSLAKPNGSGRPPTPPTGVLAAGTTVQRKDSPPASPVPNQGARGTATQPAVTDERAALEQAMQLVKAKNWSAARQALHNLVARAPQTTQYRALLCYVRGRESHAAGRVDDARIEYERALQLDPELALAKQAVVELLRRR